MTSLSISAGSAIHATEFKFLRMLNMTMPYNESTTALNDWQNFTPLPAGWRGER